MNETKYFINADKTKIAISHVKYYDNTKQNIDDFDFDIIDISKNTVLHYEGYFTANMHKDIWNELVMS